MPPHSWLFGHLLVLFDAKKRGPLDLNRFLYIGKLMDNFEEHGAFYLDVWPFSKPFIIVTSPSLATQATATNTKLATHRPLDLRTWFKPFAGGPNLFDLPEKEWKPWRTLFNKGFGTAQNLSLVPGMIEETLVFRDRLQRYAESGELMQLEPVCRRYMADMMGRAVLNAALGAQAGPHPLIDSMEDQVKWHPTNRESEPWQNFNVMRMLRQWNNGRVMDRFVGQELDQRWRECRAGGSAASGRSVIDLVLQTYLAEHADHIPAELDPAFRTFAVRQIRLFAFVGQGSTAATIVYALHLLSENPAALARLRKEHDAVFGPEPAAAAATFSAQPSLFHQLPFTRAVIKETCRLYPAATGIRQGCAGADLVGADGRRYPTEGCYIWILHAVMHRTASLWPQPDAFLPDRWLVEPGHALYPPKGAWQTFSLGPRNCIAEVLVMVEITVALVILARVFDFQEAYAEWDAQRPARKGPRTYRGERAYQVEAGSGTPADGYPCRVTPRQA